MDTKLIILAVLNNDLCFLINQKIYTEVKAYHYNIKICMDGPKICFFIVQIIHSIDILQNINE